ncbi:unnamed protein product [Closterium sp. NIES-53]
MAGRSSSSSRRVPVQVTATLKSLQREYGSLYNIVRLSIRTDLPDMPPSGLFDEPMDDPAETLAAQAAADAAAGGLEEGVEAAGRPLDAALAYSYDAQILSTMSAAGSTHGTHSTSPHAQPPQHTIKSQNNLNRILKESHVSPPISSALSPLPPQISAMSVAGSANALNSTSPAQPTTSSNPSAHESSTVVKPPLFSSIPSPLPPQISAMSAAGSALGPHSTSPSQPTASNPSNPSAHSSQPAIPSSTAATAAAAASVAAAGGGSSPFASLWKNMASQLSRAFETLLPPPSPDDAPLGGSTGAGGIAARTAAGVAGAAGAAGAAGIEAGAAAAALAGIGGGAVAGAGGVGLVVGESGVAAVDEAWGGNVQSGSSGVIDITVSGVIDITVSGVIDITVSGVIDITVSGVIDITSFMSDGDTCAVFPAVLCFMVLLQVELKDREMRLRREEWEKERSSMVASLQQLVLAKGGSVSSGSNSVEHRDGLDRNGSSGVDSSSSARSTATATATPEPDSTGDSIMRLLALQAAVSRAEEAELATAARLERVADVLGREIAKLRRDKRALESRAQLLTWRLEAVHAKLAAVFGELVGVREAMSEGRVEEGMAILEGVIGEVGRWTSNTAMEQGGQGMGGERGGVSGEEGRRDGEVVAGWWDDSPPGEWAEFGKSENELESGGGLDEERRKEERRRREELMALVGVDGEEGGAGGEGVITVFYETGWEQAFIHHSGTASGWTAVPGVRMKDSTAKGLAGFPPATVPVALVENPHLLCSPFCLSPPVPSLSPCSWTAVPGVRMKDSTAKGPAGFPLKVPPLLPFGIPCWGGFSRSASRLLLGVFCVDQVHSTPLGFNTLQSPLFPLPHFPPFFFRFPPLHLLGPELGEMRAVFLCLPLLTPPSFLPSSPFPPFLTLLLPYPSFLPPSHAGVFSLPPPMLQVYSIRASSLEFVTNNGAATWDR